MNGNSKAVSVAGTGRRVCPARTPGPLGINDQGDPSVCSWPGATPGPMGMGDYGEQVCSASHGKTLSGAGQAASWSTSDDPLSDEPLSGSASAMAVAGGVASVIRIPVPGSGGLFIELSPRGFVPRLESTSTLFIQDAIGKRHLRLDYGYNKKTGRIDYHWNQKGTYGTFGITDHTPAGRGGQTLYTGAKYFRYAGRILLIAGAAVDAYSIVVAKNRWRQTARVATGWAGAWLGCKVVGAGGAAVGTAFGPGAGTAVGGIGGCIVGGALGYAGGVWAGGELYDRVEEVFFEPLPEASVPSGGSLP